MSHHWRSAVGRPDAIQRAGGTGFPKARQPDQPGRKTYPAPCKHAWQRTNRADCDAARFAAIN
jgi:hypothetical protein